MRRMHRRWLWISLLSAGSLLTSGCDALGGASKGARAANESRAIGMLSALTSALNMYYEVKGVYPDEWHEMYPPDRPAFGPPAFRMRMGTMENREYRGYLYTYTPSRSKEYFITAVPQEPGKLGLRSFWTNQNRLVRHCWVTGTADRASIEDYPVSGPAQACRDS